MSAGIPTAAPAATGRRAGEGPARTADGSPFTGTWTLVRLALRRDRVLIPVWLLVFAAIAYDTVAATVKLYPTAATLRTYAVGVNAAGAMVAMYGPVWDVDSLGSGTTYKISALGAAMVAVLITILTVRHTRAEEEAGRLELLGAGVVGRLAGLTAALTVSTATTLGLGLLSAAGVQAGGLSTAGSLAFGLSWAVTGLAFVGIAGITAQVTTTGRAATGLAAAVLGAAYLLRAVGDASRTDGLGWLSWLSPVGWAQQVKPFAGDRWWVGGIGLGFAAATVAGAYALALRRDLGAGLIGDRPGRPRATRWLAGPAALALRLQRGILVAWTVAFAILGTVAGSLAGNLESMVDTPSARDMITKLGGESALVDAFFSVELGFVGIIASVFAIQCVTRLRTEETALHAEPLLATAVTRRRWVLAHVAVAALGAVWLLLVAGVTVGVAASASLHDDGQFSRLLALSLWQAPAVLVMTAITLVAFATIPRFVTAGWAVLVAFVLMQELGPLLEIDHRVLDVSPYQHLPRLGHFSATPLIWLAAVAIALATLGVEAFRRRDLD